MSPTGYFSLVLHAHLPFVRHPEYDDFLEEDWLFEAMTETYIPLLRMMGRLWDDGVDFRLTLSMSPPLCEMLADPLLQQRYERTLDQQVELARSQVAERRGTPFQSVSETMARELGATRDLFVNTWGRRLLPVFRSFQERGRLEIVTVGATHGFMPLMATDESRQAQVQVAVANYQKHFGRRPRGIWLPECAYAPGMEALLAEAGIHYFFMETVGLTGATPPARFGSARPVLTPHGVAAFGRDAQSSHQVWSAEGGYPGDPLYREFYRDLGYDLPYEAVRPYLHGDGVRRNVGIKYHRVTGKVPLHAKEPYVPEWAAERAADHAGDFLANRQAQVRHLASQMGVAPHITAPYDAELFGHWWFEGPQFIEMFFRKGAGDQDELAIVTPWEFLQRERDHQVVQPALSSWGDQGTYRVWLNETNAWIYRHLHRAEERMIELVERFDAPTDLQRRALTQAGRELLLAQASDWAFIMTMKTTVPYAEKRTRDHLAHFNGLYLQLTEDRLEEDWLAGLERRDSIFQELDIGAWRRRPGSQSPAVWSGPV